MANFLTALFQAGTLRRLVCANAAQAQTIDALRDDLERMILERDAMEALLKQAQRERTGDERIAKLIVYSQQLETKLGDLQLTLGSAREAARVARTEYERLYAEAGRLRSELTDLLAERDGLRSMLTQAQRELERLERMTVQMFAAYGDYERAEAEMALRDEVERIHNQRGGTDT